MAGSAACPWCTCLRLILKNLTATLLVPDILPSFTPEQMSALGVHPEEGMGHPGLLALIELKNGRNPPSYVVGTQNFYTITRYNWSSYYALAV